MLRLSDLVKYSVSTSALHVGFEFTHLYLILLIRIHLDTSPSIPVMIGPLFELVQISFRIGKRVLRRTRHSYVWETLNQDVCLR